MRFDLFNFENGLYIFVYGKHAISKMKLPQMLLRCVILLGYVDVKRQDNISIYQNIFILKQFWRPFVFFECVDQGFVYTTSMSLMGTVHGGYQPSTGSSYYLIFV